MYNHWAPCCEQDTNNMDLTRKYKPNQQFYNSNTPPTTHPHKGVKTCTSKKNVHDPPYPPISFLLSFGLCYTCWLNLYKKNIQIFITINVAGIELTF